MLNEVLTVDFHIHSIESKYKEEKDIVSNSTISNLDILFNKLVENNVNFFAFTDHNRFSKSLYLKAKLKIKDYPSIKGILAGVEFDLKLDLNAPSSGHVIALFNVTTEEEALHLEETIKSEKHILKKGNEYYDKSRFESLLKDINLGVILIANQPKNIKNNDGKNRALSDHCINPYDYIKFRYINAIEFNKSRVEGILLKNFRDLSLKDVSLLTGSDCHDWEVYPWHDNKVAQNNIKEGNIKHFSKIKCLPTFKGLVMALTAPRTRFNRSLESNKNIFIEKVSIADKNINFSNGINVIIGENGSGKTALLNILLESKLNSGYKKIKSNNKINFIKNCSKSKIKFIQQSEILDKRKEGKLFEGKNYYKEIDNSSFISKINDYSSNLYKAITNNIELNKLENDLKKITLTFDENQIQETYYVTINQMLDPSLIKNNHSERFKNINKILKNLKHEINITNYYNEQEMTLLINFKTELESLANNIKVKKNNIEKEKTIKNIIYKNVNLYLTEIKTKSNSKEREIQTFKENKQKIINSIIQFIKFKKDAIIFPKFPNPEVGVSFNELKGFVFKKIAKYNQKQLESEFLNQMFNKEFRNIEKLKNITNKDEFINAVSGVSEYEHLKEKYLSSTKKFIENQLSEDTTISENSTSKMLGNTPGEMAIAYYKFNINNNEDWDVLVIDQPEDNISNKKVNNELIKYLNSIRHSKQIILVTHNPLLVINLDADNVIYLQNKNNNIVTQYGCLEYESKEFSVLEIIAENMDGGYEAIEKRMRVYGEQK